LIVDQRRAGMLPEIEAGVQRIAGRAARDHASLGDFGGGIDGQRTRRNGAVLAKLHREKKFKRNSKRIRRSSAALW